MMRASERAPVGQGAPASTPATEWIIDTSSNSRGVKGGRIDGSRWASIDFPAPGAPLISLLCTKDPAGSESTPSTGAVHR